LRGASSRVLALVVVVSSFPGVEVRAEALHQLANSQIRAKFTGYVLTDDTHWRETYAPGGKLLIEDMGSEASTGSGRTDNDLLGKKRPGVLDECYAVWVAGDRVELRHPKYPPLQGFLRRKLPTTHHPFYTSGLNRQFGGKRSGAPKADAAFLVARPPLPGVT